MTKLSRKLQTIALAKQATARQLDANRAANGGAVTTVQQKQGSADVDGATPTVSGTGWVHVSDGAWDATASTPTAVQVGADVAGAAATVQANLTSHVAATGAAVHGLGTASTHAAGDFDSAGAAAAAQAASLPLHGTADAVAGATLTKSLTVDGGNVAIHGNAANTSALTIGAGAVSVSGSNTGDQDLSGKADKVSIAGATGTKLTVNTQGIVTAVASATAADVGADASGTAAAVQSNLDTHAGLTTAAHGGLVGSGDSRLTNARTPTAHAASHVTGSTDVIASAVAGGNAGLMTGTDKTKLDGIAAGATVGADWNTNVSNKPTLGTASAASTVDFDAAGAAAAVAGSLTTHAGLTTSAHGGLVASSDSRLTDARTPTAHASTHATGQSDALTAANVGAEPALGNPAADGYVLSSTAAGTRSWVAQAGASVGFSHAIAANTVLPASSSLVLSRTVRFTIAATRKFTVGAGATLAFK